MCYLVLLLASLPVLTVVIVAQSSGHRCAPICGLRAALNPLASRSRFALSTVSVLLSPLYTIMPTTQGVSIRSFQSSETDRPSRTICSSRPADFQSLRLFPPNLPCDLHTMLPTGFCFETKMSRASLLDARLPAVHLQRLGWSLVSATIFDLLLQLFTSTCRLPPNGHTRTPHGHTGLPQSGCSHRALTITSSHVQTQATEYWRARTTTTQSRRIQHLTPVSCD